MKKSLRIGSYFSLPTDLAAELGDCPEFLEGSRYDVDLRDAATGEFVSVRYIEHGEEAHVFVTSTTGGSLFDRVAGRVVFAMSAQTDSLWIDRHVPDGGLSA